MTQKTNTADSKIVQAAVQQPTQTELTRQGIKDAIEIVGKGLIGLVGLAYVLGLLVVTIYLRGYGLNSLSLTQFQYVIAGVWAILPILLLICFAAFAQYVIQFQEWKNKSNKQIIGKVLGNILGHLIALFVFFEVTKGVVDNFGINLTRIRWSLIPALGTLGFGLVAALIYIWVREPMSQEPAETAGGPSRLTVSVFFGVMALFLVVTYIQFFAIHVPEYSRVCGRRAAQSR